MKDYTWKYFWKLQLEEKTDIRKIWWKNRHFYICRCECWNKKEIMIDSLLSWATKSCGCISKERWLTFNKKHGLSDSKIYKVFGWMKQRCENKRTTAYKNYWWRWIKCEWWNFEEFYSDMWSSFKEWLEIERIDNNGNYSKNNCRWVSHSENNRNTRRNIIYEGKCVTEWCEELSLNSSTVFVRIFRWKTIKEALWL
jgi:hypothetical protein